jgi:hypothetical protein
MSILDVKKWMQSLRRTLQRVFSHTSDFFVQRKRAISRTLHINVVYEEAKFILGCDWHFACNRLHSMSLLLNRS